MRETFWGDLVWLWGSSWTQHAFFVFGVLMAIGALMSGWTEADNAIRLNRKLRREEKAER